MTEIKPMDAHVGRRLRLARLEVGMNQRELGGAVPDGGITFQQIQKYEKGINRIGASRLYEFSIILNRPVQWFFDGDLNITSLREVRKTTAISEHWIKIKSKEDQAAILTIVKSLAEKEQADV